MTERWCVIEDLIAVFITHVILTTPSARLFWVTILLFFEASRCSLKVDSLQITVRVLCASRAKRVQVFEFSKRVLSLWRRVERIVIQRQRTARLNRIDRLWTRLQGKVVCDCSDELGVLQRGRADLVGFASGFSTPGKDCRFLESMLLWMHVCVSCSYLILRRFTLNH